MRQFALTARSNIQAGISSHRCCDWPERVQRKTAAPFLSIISWIKTCRPDQGCHGYRSSRSKSIPWAFRRRVVQYRAAALIARLQAAGAGGHHLACATTRINIAICPADGRKAGHALRLKPDHLMGSGQSALQSLLIEGPA